MQDFCTLDLQGRTFALALHLLREVIEPPLLTRVPLAAAGIYGVANLRGELLPVLVLDPLLGLAKPEAALAQRPWMGVFETGQFTVGVLADGVGTLRRVSVEPPSEALSANPFFEGVIAASQPKAPILNLSAILSDLCRWPL